MKNYIIPICVILSVIIAAHIFTQSLCEKEFERTKIVLANQEGKLRYSEYLFNLSTSIVGTIMGSEVVNHYAEIDALDNCFDFPCLLIYVPSIENLCMSCVNYAISSVQEIYGEEWETPKIGILTCGFNGELKERILRKKVYSVKKDIFSIEDFNNPVYLVVNKEKRIISSFMPYEVMEGWTNRYLNSIRALLYK